MEVNATKDAKVIDDMNNLLKEFGAQIETERLKLAESQKKDGQAIYNLEQRNI